MPSDARVPGFVGVSGFAVGSVVDGDGGGASSVVFFLPQDAAAARAITYRHVRMVLRTVCTRLTIDVFS